MSSAEKKRARDDDTGETDAGASSLDTLQSTMDAVQSTLNDSSGKLTQLQAQLKTQVAAVTAHVAKESNALQRSGKELQEEVRRMEEHAGQMAEVVTLNVGGTKFTTSRSTLMSRPSFLATMFSGRHALPTTPDGSHFIDRDPAHFRNLLNYLRSGAIAVPSDDEKKAELLREVDFYAMADLARELRAPFVDLELGEEITAERKHEEELRAIFANADKQRRSELQPHVGLVNVFGDDGVASSLVFAPGRAFPVMLKSCLHDVDTDKPVRVAVASLAAFRTNFSKRNPNILQRLEPLLASEPILIAGGAVLHALTDGDTRTGKRVRGGCTRNVWTKDEALCRKSDVDVFLHASSPAEATRICRAIYFALAADEERWLIARGKGVVNMTCFPERFAPSLTVQVVLRLYDSPAEVLLGFDVDCACLGFDGTAVWALPRCLRALKTGVNVLNPLHAWPNRPAYEYRLAKYASRGFAVGVPGLDERRVDWLDLNRAKLGELKGLARLAKIALATTSDKAIFKSEGGGTTLHMRDPWWQRAGAPSAGVKPPLDPLACGQLDATHFVTDEDIASKALDDAGYDGELDMIFPSVFVQDESQEATGASGTPVRTLHIALLSGNYAFHRSSQTRLIAWSEINDAGTAWASEHVARKIDDAWDTSKRSREYLNAKDGELDSRYYVHAHSLPAAA